MNSSSRTKKSVPFSKLLGFLGPGFLVTVGFVDPGNWATNIEGGSRFGYELLWVVTLSTLMLVLIQHMAAKLGIATGKSLAVNIREHFPGPVTAFLGITVLAACIATDIAELLGGGIGFSLLFGIPVWLGVLFTVFLKIFLVTSQRYHRIETIIVGFLGVITLCYLIELLIVKPDWAAVTTGLVRPQLGRENIYVAMAILGALIMPHNIFLHSNVIHSREWGISEQEKIKLLRYEKIDTISAMTLGWVVNSSMIIVSAAVFFHNQVQVYNIEEASATLKPLAGELAGLLFAIALVFSGVGSSMTSSMAEANVLTGFLGKPEDPGTRLYRSAVFATSIPSFLIILFTADTFRLLIFSQIILGIQLPFTLLSLLILCRNSNVMGGFRSRNREFAAATLIAAIVIILNIYFFYTTVTGGS
ncbi:Nramp family divalent metal transporter [Chlorobium ferrooxidans]|uniref:Natural resistance-associated macrophage protein n=1 Tax=Chlorobium ferrooxidans DSM 13031 TaxID=377431 RepID=Q0YRN5_9CHLB|nr:Nramp family divalent metal transporter [Chlorobium ferrooxidans]EAT58977.1 Natural resistance-associated macrophage protein [Chlorobium ferrooxidans DSM 13031]